MAEHGSIVDFHLGAFDPEVAIAYGYDVPRGVTPRAPVMRMYTEHRAYLSWSEVEARRIPWGDARLRRLGLTSMQHALNEYDRHDAQLIPTLLRNMGRVASSVRELVGV